MIGHVCHGHSQGVSLLPFPSDCLGTSVQPVLRKTSQERPARPPEHKAFLVDIYLECPIIALMNPDQLMREATSPTQAPALLDQWAWHLHFQQGHRVGHLQVSPLISTSSASVSVTFQMPGVRQCPHPQREMPSVTPPPATTCHPLGFITLAARKAPHSAALWEPCPGSLSL